MELTKIRQRCKARFRDVGNAIYSDDNWDDYIEEAQRDVYAASPWWPFFETRSQAITVNSATTEQGVALPGDVIRVNAVYDTTNLYPYSPMYGRNSFRYYFPQPLATRGLPTNYRLRSSFLEVYPLPSGTFILAVDYMLAPSTMLAGTDEPPWPESYHQILIAGALAKAFEDDYNFQAADVQHKKFQEGIEKMKDDLLSSRLEGYTQIPFDDVDDVW